MRPIVGKKRQSGAVLLVLLTIVVLGAASLLVTKLGKYNNLLHRDQQTVKVLGEVIEALKGYAVVNQRLPCADLDEPGEVGHGFADAAGCGAEGYLPWADLGVGRRDAWGHPLRYRVDPAFSATIPDPPDTSDPSYSVVDRTGALLTPAFPDGPLAIVFSCGKDGLPNGENEDTSVDDATCENQGAPNLIYVQDTRDTSFDDILVWLPKSHLQERMEEAGKWPP